MKREHVAVLALLVVLVLAVVLIVWSGQQPDGEELAAGDREPPAAGRELRTDELSGSCGLLAGPPILLEQTGGVLGACTLTVTSTDEPFWSIPFLERFVQPELRTLVVELGDCEAAVVEIGSTSEGLEAGEQLAVAVQADGATIVVRSASGCRLVTDVVTG